MSILQRCLSYRGVRFTEVSVIVLSVKRGSTIVVSQQLCFQFDPITLETFGVNVHVFSDIIPADERWHARANIFGAFEIQ